jgi:DNA-binding NarL/FixJ family response regulator
MRIFLADDSTLVRERLKTLFSAIEGVEIAGEAYDVPGTIDGIQKCKPDVLILDIRMPGGNGFDVLRSLKQSQLNTIVIVLTNYPFPEYRKISAELGAQFFFDKSGELEEVRKVLEKLLQEMSGVSGE